MPKKKEIFAQLNNVIDPELNIPITDMGLVYGVKTKKLPKNKVKVIVTMTLTTVGCPLFDVIADEIKREIKKIPDVTEVEIDLTFEPPWTPEKMTAEAKAHFGWD